MGIRENVRHLLSQLPDYVILLAATKSRTVDEIREAVNAGIRVIGENYVQEAAKKYEVLGKVVEWHFIGHLQRNKVKKAVRIFDVIETVDGEKIAAEINKRCSEIDKIMPVMIEINSGKEPQKVGVYPEKALNLAEYIVSCKYLKLIGVMTMGPVVENPEDIRPYFKITREIFEKLKNEFPECEIKYLSMGMTDTWKIAVEEGANIVRIGTGIFGPRKNKI